MQASWFVSTHFYISSKFDTDFIKILLGVWGPIVASIGSLLTIVLVFISDVIFGDGIEQVTLWNATGAGAIVVAFGILAHDTLRRR
jgi:hypothetical protein